MPKSPPVEYVIAKPAAPSAWKRHRHQLLFLVGLLIGIWLATGHAGHAEPPAHQHPGPMTPETSKALRK